MAVPTRMLYLLQLFHDISQEKTELFLTGGKGWEASSQACEASRAGIHI